ncbi:TetR/AcrR family transcriptional regulator [Umezawaea endophytica]|uniref:TetR/AcrR family transcriptional regulator n=1 Tax=Umezawaea endophytica TaxID=1654476 RepID=A0A9X2VN68_9PSEU|nr:TetR/AcrR family transcriptional regulator [Umezawaea endophytica]MCS7479606.1 TetR/AcrR family transcriptional regulator [Umezawaea endophytica]
MARLTRAQTQELTRARILTAAKAEFTEHGYRDAKIDRIADRADLTRGAVYSNFPGKRALYFAVLAHTAEAAPEPRATPGHTVRDALGALARAWAATLPMATDTTHGTARLGVHLLPEIMTDDLTRQPFAQLLALDAIALGLALEQLDPTAGRLVRVAEAALTTLHGATTLAAAAPGFGEPFNTVRACEQLADLDLHDQWFDPHLSTTAHTVDEPWEPLPATDLLTGRPAPLDDVVLILGTHRLSAVEAPLRAGAAVTAAIVTAHPDELSPLIRLTTAHLRDHLRHALPHPTWPRLRLVNDDRGFLAAAAGVTPHDTTETALRITSGRVTARAHGFGAAHAIAAPTSADHPT